MLTFAELYQTLLGFVFFKLYSDISLVYPPPLNFEKDEAGAGVGAFTLEDVVAEQTDAPAPVAKKVEVDGKTVTNKDVKRAIMDIAAAPLPHQSTLPASTNSTDATPTNVDTLPDDFIVQPSKSAEAEGAPLLTMRDISILPSSNSAPLFSSLTIFLARETPRPLLEFVIRAYGGRVGWPATLGAGSPFTEDDPSITHVIVDRPLGSTQPVGRRKYVQPQWVVDSVNAGRLLVEDAYGQGKTLPPHLSPFGEGASTYVPGAEEGADAVAAESEEESEEEEQGENEDEDEEMDDVPEKKAEPVNARPALAAAAAAPTDQALRRAAEIEAERAGTDYSKFEADLKKAIKTQSKTKAPEPVVATDTEAEMNKMMMSNKQRKLYERMKFGERKRATEVSALMAGALYHTNSEAHRKRNWNKNATRSGKPERKSCAKAPRPNPDYGIFCISHPCCIFLLSEVGYMHYLDHYYMASGMF